MLTPVLGIRRGKQLLIERIILDWRLLQGGLSLMGDIDC
jgi:hypothetical protein